MSKNLTVLLAKATVELEKKDDLIRDLVAALWGVVTDEDKTGDRKQEIAHAALVKARAMGY